jgi:hypothetical protein
VDGIERKLVVAARDLDRNAMMACLSHPVVMGAPSVGLSAIENHVDRERSENRRDPTGMIAGGSRLTS